MPFHEVYADGSPRPLLRGWLHGIATIVTLPLVYNEYTNSSSSLPLAATPGLLAICTTLVFSSLVHLVPWKSTTVLKAMVRLDKTGILAICGASFWGPQLLPSDVCKPSFVVALLTVATPVSMAMLGTWCGFGPTVFLGCAIAFGQTLYFYGTQVQDDAFFVHSLACAVLYGTGLALYVSKVGGHCRYWGYHEWMHVMVTLGFVVNARGLLLMSAYTDETCSGSSAPTTSYNNSLDDLGVESTASSLWKNVGL